MLCPSSPWNSTQSPRFKAPTSRWISRSSARQTGGAPTRMTSSTTTPLSLLRVTSSSPPLLVDQSISVTGVRISPDLSVVTLFVKPLAAENELEIVAALNNAKGYVRGELGHALNHLRIVPQLRFEIDRSFDEGAHIDALLRSREVARDLAPHDEDDDDKDA